MIVSFKFYVMNIVDFVIDFYSHITSHVSQVFASCTHNTSYSLLNIVHIIVCVYGLTNQVRKILWVLCKADLLFKKKGGDCLKSKFWKNSFLEKKPNFLKAYLKALNIRYKNAWVWDEKFFKNTWIQPKSSKIKIFNKFVLEAQTLNTFCIKIKELLILDGHNKITHNIMYQV